MTFSSRKAEIVFSCKTCLNVHKIKVVNISYQGRKCLLGFCTKKSDYFLTSCAVQRTSVLRFSGCKTLVKEDNKPLTQISCKNSSESPVKLRMGPLDCSRVWDMLQLSNDSIQQRATLPGFVQLNVLLISNTLLFNWIKEFQRTTFFTTFQLWCENWNEKNEKHCFEINKNCTVRISNRLFKYVKHCTYNLIMKHLINK